jgi:exosortase family protein XrtM
MPIDRRAADAADDWASRRATRVPTRGLIVFLAALALFTLGEYAFRPQIGPFVNGTMTVRPAARLVGFLARGEQVRARGDRIQSRMAYIRVAQGCEGIDVMLMFAAATLAVSMSWRRRALACLTGVGVIYVCNLIRVAGLWFCMRYWPSHFQAMHVIVGQTVIIVVAILLFAAWTLGAPAQQPRPGRA